MKTKYYLPGLSQCEQTNEKVDETKYPKIAAFLNDLDSFCRKYCNNLDKYIVREKRFLDFDTPNRAVITHEYDIKLGSKDSINEFPYYLFNPIKRLGWLKIYADEERLIAAGEKDVKDAIRDAISDELTDGVYSFETLWQNKVGLPCFVFLKDIEKKPLILTASYYDSLTTNDEGSHIFKLLFSPLKERDIQYDYLPLKGRSSWLYLKAPDNFDIETKIKEEKTEDYSIELSGGGNGQPDPDILSLTIIHKNRDTKTIEKIPIQFSIVLPKTVKIWFIVIYWCTVIPAVLLLCDIGNTILLKFVKPIIPIDIPGLICNNEHFTEWLLAIVAAVIATRSWMIKEETILKFYSMAITSVVGCTILLYLFDFLVL